MKSEELFPTADFAMDSPRLAWVKRHQIITYRLPSTGEWLAGFVAGPNYAKIAASADEKAQWFCDQTSEYGDDSIGISDTEDAQSNRRQKRRLRPEVTKAEREHTPKELAEWLVRLARRTKPPIQRAITR